MTKSGIYYTLFSIAGFVVLWYAESGNMIAGHVVMTAAYIIAAIIGVILFIQICFWVYQWMVFGHPLNEGYEGQRTTIVYRDHRQNKPKKMCPICKRPTRCTIKKSDNGKFWVHVHKEN